MVYQDRQEVFVVKMNIILVAFLIGRYIRNSRKLLLHNIYLKSSISPFKTSLNQ